MENCCERKKVREKEEYQLLKNRLNRIEGQIRGISRMVENDAYCADVLTQVCAVQSAISAFAKELLASHIKSCVTEDIIEGRLQTVDELVGLVKRLMK